MLIETDAGVAWRHGENWNEPPGVIGPSRHLTLYEAGEEIFGPTAREPVLFQVAFGVARVCNVLNDGRRTIAAFHLPGEIFGFEPEGYLFRAEAVDGLGLRTMPMPHDRALAGDLLRAALAHLMAAQEHLLVVGRQTASERIAAFLLDMARRQNREDSVNLPMPRSDIADYLALTPETVCRVFKHLREEGFIDFTSSRHVVIRSGRGLRALVN